MTKALFYIIIISQVWLSIGSACTSLMTQDHEIIELIGEEEKEKEKELEKELEQIKHSKDFVHRSGKEIQESIHQADCLVFHGRDHLQNNTPPPEFV